jgi:hypothetical protein
VGRALTARGLTAVARDASGAVYKLLRFAQREGSEQRTVREELYELGGDPTESHNLIDTEPARRAALGARLSRHFAAEP